MVRAGGGSARDTLSVLDQLMGGAGADGITYALAAGLLGYTPDTLLDEVVDAFAAGDGAAVFGVVDKVIETGQDPRRFTEDLLRRLRDLVIVSAVPDAPATGLIDIAEDAAERLVAQAARFGPAELSRAADLVATGLTEMRGATAPRLLLELICARVLLPGADHSTEGVMARLDRLERRMTITGGDPLARGPAPAAEPAARVEPPARSASRAADRAAPQRPRRSRRAGRPGRPADRLAEPEARPRPPSAPAEPPPSRPQPRADQPRPSPRPPAGSPLSLVDVRRLWPDIVEATKQRRRVTWIYLTQQAQVVAVDAQTLTLGFANVRRARLVRQRRQRRDRPAGGDRRRRPRLAGRDDRRPGSRPRGAPRRRRARRGRAAAPRCRGARRPSPRRRSGRAAAVRPSPSRPPRARRRPPARRSRRPAGRRPRRARRPRPPADSDGGARPDDADAESSGLDGAQLLQEALGAQVIEEIPHQ